MKRGASPRASFSEPYFLFLLFVALSLGTLAIKQSVRLAFLWTTLVALSVVYCGSNRVQLAFTLPGVGRGLLLGLVIAVPVLAFLSGPLRTFNETLYGTNDMANLYLQVCFAAAPAEEIFFRGIVQQRKGLWPAVGLYGIAVVLMFVPHTPLLAALIVLAAMGTLGLAFGYIAAKHGLAAAIACRWVVALLVQVFPSLFVVLRMLFA